MASTTFFNGAGRASWSSRPCNKAGARDYTWQSSAWVETNETRYIYDGGVVVQERNSNNTPTVTYTRGLDLSLSLGGAGGIGGMLARTDTNSTVYYHADGSGNITALMQGARGQTVALSK